MLLDVLAAFTASVYSGPCFSREHVFKHSPFLPSLFPLLIQCHRCLSPLLNAWVLMDRFPGLASHGKKSASRHS